MSTPLLWVLIWLGIGMVFVQRRSMAIMLLTLQTLLLGSLAVRYAIVEHSGLVAAAAGLIARAIILPILLLFVVRGTREPRRVVGERYALPRMIAAVIAMSAAAVLIPVAGQADIPVIRTAVALLVLGIVVAAVRGPVVFQAIGFLVAENGVYLAGISVNGGLPGIVEIALLFDLLLVVVVAAAFGSKIHGEFGTSDTTLLRSLRD